MPSFSREEAERLIKALFNDAGATVLSEANRDDWAEALSNVPPTALELRGKSEHSDGERLLSRVRDFWASIGDVRPAIAATRGVLRLRVNRLGNEHADTLLELGALGALADRAGRFDDAAQMLAEAYEGLKAVVGPKDMRVAIVAGNYGIHLSRGDDIERAAAMLEHAYRIRKEQHPKSVGVVAAQLADLRLKQKRLGEAVPLLVESYGLAKAQWGPMHRRTVARARVLVAVLSEMRLFLDAEPVLRALHRHAVESGEDADAIATATFELGIGLLRVRLDEEGFRHVQQGLQMTRALGDPHPELPARLSKFSGLVRQRGRVEDAGGLLREAVEAATRLYGQDSPEVALRYLELGTYLKRNGSPEEALGWLDTATALLRGNLGDKNSDTAAAVRVLIPLLLDNAEEALRRRDKQGAAVFKARALELVPVVGYNDPLAVRVERLRI